MRNTRNGERSRRSDRGFASMNREQQREIASRGGRSSYGGRTREYSDRDRENEEYSRSERRGRGSYNDSRYSDEGEGSGRGWFGDPEGHAEAAEKGWEHREHSNGGSNRSGDRYESGNRSRRSNDSNSYDRRDHGQGGWFGDPEGHAEAAEKGWEHREHRNGGSNSGRYESRSRSRRDNDSYEGRDHGQGGWFGDSEGHAEAAEKGWEHREHRNSRRY
jgi:hypothetical protein